MTTSVVERLDMSLRPSLLETSLWNELYRKCPDQFKWSDLTLEMGRGWLTVQIGVEVLKIPISDLFLYFSVTGNRQNGFTSNYR